MFVYTRGLKAVPRDTFLTSSGSFCTALPREKRGECPLSPSCDQLKARLAGRIKVTMPILSRRRQKAPFRITLFNRLASSFPPFLKLKSHLFLNVTLLISSRRCLDYNLQVNKIAGKSMSHNKSQQQPSRKKISLPPQNTHVKRT